MEPKTVKQFFYSFLISYVCFSTTAYHSSAADTLSAGKSLTPNQSLVSKNEIFQLGFFQPGNSYNYYIGIWYRKSSVTNKTYLWVANRETPLTGSAPLQLKLLEDGNLVLFSHTSMAVWSTNTTAYANSSEAVLGDDGNFVLRDRARPSDVYWQSFDYPTDTWLPGAKIRYDHRKNKSVQLTSWKNPNDPSDGLFSLALEPVRDQYMLWWNKTTSYWNSGAWNGVVFTNAPEMREVVYNYSYIKNENESYITYSVSNTYMLTRFVLDMSGQFKQFDLAESTEWIPPVSSQPKEQCDVYAFCGAFGVCNQNVIPVCKCIKGFQPRSPLDWNMSAFSSGGCSRKSSLLCGQEDTFYMMSNVKLPSKSSESLGVASADQCKAACLSNCSCSAFAYTDACSIWNGDLLGLQQLSNSGGSGGKLYVRVAASDNQKAGGITKGATIGVIIGAVAAVLTLSLIVSYIWLKWLNSKDKINNSQDKDLELPLFDFAVIERASNEFSVENKIGQGGFGPVYKGTLPTGEEIAIKRLSKESRQGLNEFMNEVLLIAKLKHRNLVQLLGCSIHGDERMLIYEYMPNKSLDFFIFHKTSSVNLNWKEGFDIILGIARGLLYLHRDSRLRIIHRDLKAANILLDSEMKPKISDFGMARLLGGDQTEEKTKRVVGTLGYMPPEYAIDGNYSVKSDVFSFGVLVLEMISGKRNRGFRHADHDLNLLGHTWKLLMDKKALEIIDPYLEKSCNKSEVIKCIQVGLLCVQKFPEDRPAMSNVVSMLETDGDTLPSPKQPGFFTESVPSETESSSSAQANVCTANAVTITLLEGR